ncbi:hypothetical protein ACIFQM_05630 [Paenibacillus sp. NRS-1782]|uniref:hypothetical protein n=1 Tax=unclassified Paenibacillus TaxID=185978 RepID=UPI003D278AAE
MSSAKQPVQFRPFIHTEHAYQRLRICKRCGQFTALWEDKCTSCGRNALVPVEQYAHHRAKLYFRKDLAFGIVLLIAAVFFGHSTQQMLLCGIVGALLLLPLVFLQQRIRSYEQRRQLIRLFRGRIEQIKEGLNINHKNAVALRQLSERVSYEMLREIAALIHNDRIRLQQVALLQAFVLRKDMELTLDPLLIKSFEPLMVRYIGEIARLNRELIKDRTFRYVTFYERRILEMAGGEDILVRVASAAVRKKRYVVTHSGFISRYVRKLPKERVQRLYHIIQENPYEPFGDLADEVKIVYLMEQYKN